MEFKEMQKKVIQNALNYGERFNIEIESEFAVLKLIEEVGEFTEALLTLKSKNRPEKLLPEVEAKKKVEQELADIVGMAIVNAHVLNIDIEKALYDKWIDKKTS